MSKRLWIDRRFAVTGTTSKINLDNPIAIHTFIVELLEALPQYVDNATALAAGLTVGKLYNNTTTDAITYVV